MSCAFTPLSGDMKRTAMKPWRRPRDEQTDPVEREFVMRRDGGCVLRVGTPVPEFQPLVKLAGPCRSKWGTPFDGLRRGDENTYLTVDGFQLDYAWKGQRAIHDRQHMVCVCWGHHLPPGGFITRKDSREAERAYSARLYS